MNPADRPLGHPIRTWPGLDTLGTTPRLSAVFASLRAQGIKPPPEEPPTRIERLHEHDTREERRYLFGEQSRRLTGAWSITWLTWDLGVGAAHSPSPYDERWSAWLYLGPFTFEVFVPAVRP